MQLRITFACIGCLILLFLTATYGIAQSDFWEQTHGPYQGDIFSLEVDHSGYMYVGTANTGQGVYRSTNNGKTWEPANTGLNATDIWDLAVHPRGDILLSATLVFGSPYNGIYRSTDHGANWTQLQTEISLPRITAVLWNGQLTMGTRGRQSTQEIRRIHSWLILPTEFFAALCREGASLDQPMAVIHGTLCTRECRWDAFQQTRPEEYLQASSKELLEFCARQIMESHGLRCLKEFRSER